MAKSDDVTRPGIPSNVAGRPLTALAGLDPFCAEGTGQSPPTLSDRSARAGGDETISSIRALHAQGHLIEVKTSYAVSIDGQPAPIHMMVDADGQLWSALCPYRTFPTALDLVRYLLEHSPDVVLAALLEARGSRSRPADSAE